MKTIFDVFQVCYKSPKKLTDKPAATQSTVAIITDKIISSKPH